MNFIFDTPETRAGAVTVAKNFSMESLAGNTPSATEALEAANL